MEVQPRYIRWDDPCNNDFYIKFQRGILSFISHYDNGGWYYTDLEYKNKSLIKKFNNELITNR